MTYRATLCLLVLVSAARASTAGEEENRQLLESIRRKVMEQLSRSSNYACVETLERSYFRNVFRQGQVCAVPDLSSAEKMLFQDRLRLDLAVSGGSEIYSWHGENQYSSATIADIVQSGIVSSGNFVGFLRNIFVAPGVNFNFKGKGHENHKPAFRFEYEVPEKHSLYRISGLHDSARVSFHGTFSVDAGTLELINLTIFADKIPARADLCSAKNQVRFQLADISGHKTLIPARFELETYSDLPIHSISRGSYADCREFHAESTLRFDVDPSTIAGRENKGEEWLPAGLELPLALTTTVDSKTSFGGDPVEAALTAPVPVPSLHIQIPKGAVLYGRITQLESYYEPEAYFLVRLAFDRVSFEGKSMRMNAVHRSTANESKTAVAFANNKIVTGKMADSLRAGTILFRGSQLHLDRRFRGTWETEDPAPKTPDRARK